MAAATTSQEVEINASAHEVLEALHRIPISSVLAHKKKHKSLPRLVALEANATVADALQRMNQHNILAIPICTENSNEREFNGIISVYDILANLVFQKLFDKLEDDSTPSGSEAESFKKWLEIDDLTSAYFSQPVFTLLGCTAESSTTWTLRSTDPVSSLLQVLATPPYHRILVIDIDEIAKDIDLDEPSTSITGSSVVLLTQTDLLRWLLDYRDSVAPIAMAKLLSLPIASVNELATDSDMDPNQPTKLGASAHKRVISVPVDFTALSAFKLMYMHRVSSVAIVDPSNGGLVANLSASDLRGITPSKESLDALLLPVFEFLETKTHRTPDQVKADQIRAAFGTVPVSEAVKMCLNSRIHRVWIQSSDEKPVGVVSFSDILSLFIPHGERAM